MGPVTKNAPNDIATLLRLTKNAQQNGWYIILSASSGLGWRTLSDSAVNQRINDHMLKFDSSLEPVALKMFTEDEAKAYMHSHNIDVNKWKSDLLHTTNGNPLLLSFYQYTKGSADKFGRAHARVNRCLHNLSHDFIESMKSEVFVNTMSKCHQWLVYAVHGTRIPINEEVDYTSSYVALEHLTYLKERDDNTFVIEQSFPMFYEFLAKELVNRFRRGDTEICNTPIVQGLIFESKFLQNSELHDMHIKGLNKDGQKSFYFPLFPHARCQEDKPVRQLSIGQLYHLRSGHPAIDGVCIAMEQSGQNYLVLMQVSLSKYREHEAKADAILKNVAGKEKAAAAAAHHDDTVSIVEYYRKMTKLTEDDEIFAEDHVLFVYVSPEELGVPQKSTFPDIFFRRETRSGLHSNSHFYGFVEADTPVARLLITLEQNVRGL